MNGADSGELTKAHEFVFSALFQYIFIYLVAMADEVQKILEMLLQGNTPENFSTLVPLLNQFNYEN